MVWLCQYKLIWTKVQTGVLIPLAELKLYQEELNQLTKEKESAKKDLIAIENKINKIENKKAEEDIVMKNLISNLEKSKIEAGFFDVSGQGAIITIKEPVITDEYQNDTIDTVSRCDLLLQVVNKLKDAGAEAISINEQRIIAITEINPFGNVIKINGLETASPYTIKAIGDSKVMEARLTISRGILESVRNEGLEVDIKKKEKVLIGRYNSQLKFKFAKPIISKET